MSDFHICISVPRRLTRGGSGGDPPVLFQKLEKSTLIWRKNALIMVIYG